MTTDTTKIDLISSSDVPDTLDRADRAILEALIIDGRLNLTELARRVGLSKTPVATRIKRLEEAGIITGYTAQVNWRRLGLGHIAFVEVKLSDTRQPALNAFNAAVRAIPEVEECHMIAGGYDYLLKVRTHDIVAYREVMADKLSALPHVASTSTFVAMEAVKSD